MAAVFCDEAVWWPLLYMLGDTTNGKALQTIRLFVNDHTPTAASTKSNFTEMAGLAYSSINFAGTSWGFNLDTTTHVSTSVYSVRWQFIPGTPINVYGWMITDTGASWTRVIMADRFSDAPISVGGSRLTLAVTLNITLKIC